MNEDNIKYRFSRIETALKMKLYDQHLRNKKIKKYF